MRESMCSMRQPGSARLCSVVLFGGYFRRPRPSAWPGDLQLDRRLTIRDHIRRHHGGRRDNYFLEQTHMKKIFTVLIGIISASMVLTTTAETLYAAAAQTPTEQLYTELAKL